MSESAFQPRRRTGDAAVAPPKPTGRWHRLAQVRLTTVRQGLTLALMGGLAVLAGNVFDRFEPSLLLPVGLVAVAAILSPRLPRRIQRIGQWLVILAAVAAAAVVVCLLAGGSFADAIPGITDGPRRLLTTEWPSPRDPTALATIAALLGVATALAVRLARRPNLHLAPLVPVVATLVAIIALSAPERPPWWILVTLAVLTLLFGLTRQHTIGERPGARIASLGGERALALGVLAMGVAGLATATTLALSQRADPRTVSEPQSSASLLRPLEAVVAQREATPAFDVYSITDASTLIGQQMPTRWRTAALDTYDGQRWVPRAAIRPIGDRLGQETSPDVGRPAPAQFRIDVLTDGTDLVPLPGRPLDLTSNPPIGIATDTGRVIVKLDQRAPVGTQFRLIAEPAPTAGEIVPASIIERPVGEITGRFTDTARELAGQGDTLSRLQRIEEELRGWDLDDQATYGGQQQKMIETFVFDTHRGTREQFVSAFVLLARSLGIDARVATGFAVSADRASSPLTISSADAAAWAEVNVADVGWMAFDPVPDRPAAGDAPEEAITEPQTPAAAQPPSEPPTDPTETDEADRDDTTATAREWGTFTVWVARIAVGIGVVALPLAVAVCTVLAIKLVRRRRRLRAANTADRVRGAWANVTDALVDAGLTIEPSWTDDRVAAMGAPLVGPVPHELRRLAQMSTAATFGPPVPDEVTANALETESTIDAAIADTFTAWQRLKWRLSLRSLRSATRSPIGT